MTTFPLLHKSAGPLFPRNTASESSFIVFEGKLLLLVFNRQPCTATPTLLVFDCSGPQPVVLQPGVPCPAVMCDAAVFGGIIHCYGSTADAQGNIFFGNTYVHFTLDANFVPSQATSFVVGLPNIMKENVAICRQSPTPDGYVLAVGQIGLNGNTEAAFLVSATADFSSWRLLGDVAPYDGGPMTIDYVNGHYFGTTTNNASTITSAWMAPLGNLNTLTSAIGFDFLHADNDSEILLSDPSIVEYNGNVIVFYENGNQQTFADSHSGVFRGTLAQLDRYFFPA